MTKHEARILEVYALSQDNFAIRISGLLRHLSFVLRHLR